MTWEYTKQFWINKIEYCDDYYSFQSRGYKFKNPDWKQAINNATSLEEIDKMGRGLREEVTEGGFTGSLAKITFLNSFEEDELRKNIFQDLTKWGQDVKMLESQNIVLETTIDEYDKKVKDIENKLKSIIGDDLTNWESKIVKAGSSDKDIVDLKKKISELATEKENLQAEIKKKQDQILNHKCDTPNNAELNQIKEELKKMTQEKDRLQNELNKKGFGPSLPTPPSNHEEEKKEELENSKLSLEQLREKLKTTQQEVKSLRTQLNQQNNRSNHQGNYNLGTIFVVGVVWLLFGSLIMLFYKKKKKRNSK